jgi:hypothetical protein
MKGTLAPKISEIAIPVVGGQRYFDRQVGIIDLMEKEKRYEERGRYGAKALAITGALLFYNFILAEAGLYVGLSGLAKLLEK